MIYEDMLRNGYQKILIFEDDAVPDDRALPLIPHILEELPANWELLMWGWDKNGSPPATAGLKKIFYHLKNRMGSLKWDHQMIRNLYAQPYSKHLKKAGFHDYTYAYAISASAAQKLVAMQTPIQYIADNLLAHAATKEFLKSFISWPVIFLHEDPGPAGTVNSYIR